MFCPTHAVDVAVVAQRTAGTASAVPASSVLDYNEYWVRLELKSPTAKRWSPPAEVDSSDAAVFLAALDWWTRLRSGVPVAEWASTGLGEDNLRTREMRQVLGIAEWKWSWIPLPFWRVRAFQTELQLAMTAERRRALEVVRQHLPPHLKLHPYQEEGVAFVLAHIRLGRPGAFLPDEMGLENPQALVVMSVLAAENPRLRVLVVCPGFLRFNWADRVSEVGCDTPQIMKKAPTARCSRRINPRSCSRVTSGLRPSDPRPPRGGSV